MKLPEFRVLLVEVPGDPRRALPQGEDLGRDLVPLPLALPGLAWNKKKERNVRTKYAEPRGKTLEWFLCPQFLVVLDKNSPGCLGSNMWETYGT